MIYKANSKSMCSAVYIYIRSGWKGTEENVIKPTPQDVDSFLFCYF